MVAFKRYGRPKNFPKNEKEEKKFVFSDKFFK